MSLLQSAVRELASLPAARRPVMEQLLVALFEQGRDGRFSKLFREYAAEFGGEADRAFDELYLSGLLATRTGPLPLTRRDRFLRLLREFEPMLGLEGMVAECGCFRGLSSYLLCSRLRRHDAAFGGTGYRIFDSFAGLSELRAEDALSGADPAAPHAQNMRAGHYAASLQEVQRALAPFPGIAYFPGWIPAAFPQDEARYRFVHVDVDLYQPTKDSLDYFWPRLLPGARMVCDDYNWPGAKRAVDEFCAAKGIAARITASTQAVIERERD